MSKYVVGSERWKPSKEMSKVAKDSRRDKNGDCYSYDVFLLRGNQKETVRIDRFRKCYCPSRHCKKTP